MILTMPDTMSVERRALLKAYGAEVVLTDGAQGMAGAIAKAQALAAELPGSFIPGQFANPDNPGGPSCHHGAGDLGRYGWQGGYFRGRRRYRRHPHRRGPIPEGTQPQGARSGRGARGFPSAVRRGCRRTWTPGNRRGLSAGNSGHCDIRSGHTGNGGASLCRRWRAGAPGRNLGGHFLRAALWAATELARQPENTGKIVVVLLPDTGDRYLSTPLFQA